METKIAKVVVPPLDWDEYYASLPMDVRAFYSEGSLMFGKAIGKALDELGFEFPKPPEPEHFDLSGWDMSRSGYKL